MKFHETPLSGLYVVELELLRDERGFFARSFCAQEFATLGLVSSLAQCNTSYNEKAGTLRGLHFQAAPHEEAKLVRCTRGAVYDVAVDLRQNSSSYRRWYALTLNPDNAQMLYIPAGFAHGFQTLLDGSEVLYLMSEYYHPESARGVRWDDPALAIKWPIANPIVSERDRTHPLLDGEDS